MTKVLCFGTFDLVHPGHLSYFEQAKQHGDELVVVVAHDDNVKREKGRSPQHTQEERVRMVSEQPIVDKAVPGNKDDKLRIVEEEKPDAIVLGYDQNVDEEKLKAALQKRGLQPKILRANAYHPEKYKSSLLRFQEQRRPQ